MQGRIVYFGLGALAGVGVGAGYWRGYHKLNLSDIPQSQPGRPADSPPQDLLCKYGSPKPPFSRHNYTSHSVLYDHVRKVPLWSAEVITSQRISGSANRRNSKFQPDPTIPAPFSSSNADYRRSGWSRGHMTPAADCKHCQEAMDDSHYLTNIVPQDLDNNSGYWNRLEIFCRDLTKRYSTVHVVSGPLYLPSDPAEDEDGKRYVKYQVHNVTTVQHMVIGDGNVAVPTHLYKVILAERESGDLSDSASLPVLGVFVVPNKPLHDEDLSTFQTTLHELETLSGVSFHPKLDRSQVRDLCEVDTCQLMTTLELKEFVYSLKLKRAKGEQQIESILDQARADGMEHNSTILQAAAKRREELGTNRSRNP